MSALDRFDRRLTDVVTDGALTPGAIVRVSREDAVVLHRAVGWAQDHDETGPLAAPRPMEPDTIVDVASLTKVFTTAAVMRLVERGDLDLDDHVHDLVPGLAEAERPPVTIEQLLTHRAGLAAWQPTYLFTGSPREAVRWAYTLPRRAQPGVERRYSDLGFMVLGAVIEEVAGEPLDEHLGRTLWGPLGMVRTRFRPPAHWRDAIAATSTGNRTERRMIATDDPEPVDGTPDDFTRWRAHTLVGEVHDGNAAHTFGGVAAHAGVFTTADDLTSFGLALIDALHGRSAPWSTDTVERFLVEPHDRGQALGWWTRRPNGSAAGFGHRGFTGCELSIIPATSTVVVLLTNRLHTETDPPVDHAPLWAELLDAVRTQRGWGPIRVASKRNWPGGPGVSGLVWSGLA